MCLDNPHPWISYIVATYTKELTLELWSFNSAMVILGNHTIYDFILNYFTLSLINIYPILLNG